MGVRSDSYGKAGFIINTSFNNFLSLGSLLVIDLNLSKEIEFDSQYFQHLSFWKKMGIRVRLNYARKTVDIFDHDEKIGSYDIESAIAEGLFGTIFSKNAVLGLGVRGEYVDLQPYLSPIGYDYSDEKLIMLFGQLLIDTRDRVTFPTHGTFLEIRVEGTDQKIGSSASFLRNYIDWQSFFKVSSKTSFLHDLFLGTTSNNEIPLNYKFKLGGMNQNITLLENKHSFLGLKPSEEIDDHIKFYQIGIQHELSPNKFIILQGNIGSTSNKLNFSVDKLLLGTGITFGMTTPLGPIELTTMSGNRHRFLVYVNLGYKF